MIIADAPPPPLQILAIPYFALFYLKSITIYYFRTEINPKTNRAPELPIGCPNATAPPLTLTLSIGMSSNFILARTVAAKASLISWYSI